MDDEDIDREWREEVRRRLEEPDDDSVPWELVRASLSDPLLRPKD
jgi:hypothetical protein